MQEKELIVWCWCVLLLAGRVRAVESAAAEERPDIQAGASRAVDAQSDQRGWVGQDLHLSGRQVISHDRAAGQHVLVFQDGFSMLIGGNHFSGSSAVVWLESVTGEVHSRARIGAGAWVYMRDAMCIERAAAGRTVDLREKAVDGGRSTVVAFDVSGEVFVTVEQIRAAEAGDLEDLDLYVAGRGAVDRVRQQWQMEPEALRPKLAARETAADTTSPETVAAQPAEKEAGVRYPVNIAPAGEAAPKIESAKAPDGTDIATVIGRFYLWRKRDERGGLLELQADNAVIFYLGQRPKAPEDPNRDERAGDILVSEAVKAIYMSGDVVMTEGTRTVRADEIYYDFEQSKALAINAVMRTFDVPRGIPIYVRAAKLRQLAENKFAGEDITLTTSEFYLPQISLTASKVIVTDTSAVDEQLRGISDSSYDAEMQDVRLRMYDTTIFRWPYMRSNMQRPDTPIQSVHAGHDGTFGTSVETRWHLNRLLGRQEQEGTESTYALDYYSKRGPGTGVEIDYERENYFGRLLGYVMRDTGEDRLGRHESREDLEPPRRTRGRVKFQHRHFLPYNWQLTSEVGYAGDENFIEQYYRGEFNADKEQETIAHLKRSEDNWAIALLGKWRINDYADQLEELPSAELHWTGQSLFDDRFTLYSDSQISGFRQRIGDGHAIAMNDERFSFASHRTELDMPVRWERLKLVPFAAGTFGYDDRSGFTRTLVDGSNAGAFGDDEVLIGELGARLFPQPLWKVYPDVKSRLWDLDQLRHIIEPQVTGVLYEESDSVIEQRDTLNVGISQRLQTKRGAGEELRTVDWMRLDVDVVWVNNSGGADAGPDRLIWNKPIVPLRVLSAPSIFNGDLIAPLRRFEMFGPRRNYIAADYVWRLSDTTAILSDGNFDMQSGVMQQYNFGLSRLVWPNLSYYIGSRYLRRVEVLDEKGSNAFTFAATYVLDPRYTAVFSQQFDFDYGASVRSDITLIRRYHRIQYALTFSADASLDRQAIVFSIWPEGVPELALGPRRYMGLGGSAGY